MSFIKKLAAPIGVAAGFALGGPAGAAIGGSIGSAVGGSSAASDAAKAQQSAADKSTQLQREQFEYIKKIMAPYQQAGTDALPALSAFIKNPTADFSFDYASATQSPEYQALLQQGEQAVARNASATGGLRSGNANVAFSSLSPQIIQQLRGNAMQQYELNQGNRVNQYNMLMGQAGLGTGAANQVGNAAQTFGQNAGANALRIGDARANKYLGQNQAIQGLTSDLGGLFLGGGF